MAFPTETFYGLAVDPRSAAAVAKVFELKRRGPDQPLPLIASDIDQITDHVGTLTPLATRLASRGWPGPLTLIIPASHRLCDAVHLSTGKVAVRVPSDPVARTLAARVGHAITSTSANISGDPPAATPEQALVQVLRGRLQGLGPVSAQALAGSLGVADAAVRAALETLRAEGWVMHGRFTAEAGEAVPGDAEFGAGARGSASH